MDYRTLVVLIPLLLLISCGPASELATPTEALVAIDLATSTPTGAPPPAEPSTLTPTSTVEMAEVSPTATAVELEPTEALPDTPTPGLTVTEEPADTPPSPSPTPTETATVTPIAPPIPEVSGIASFQNNLAIADKFVLKLTGVSAPPEGQTYQGWLISGDGAATSIGTLNLSSDGSIGLEWNSPNSENLLSRYSRLQVTLEPASGSASPTGQVVFAGELSGEVLTKARRLFVKNEGEPATPLNTAFAPGLIAQTDVAVQHVQNAVNAAAIGAFPEMRTHLEHVVNILEGATGPRFGDHDGNGVAENPGDGFGVVGYARQIAELLKDKEAVVAAAADVQTQSTAIQDKCLEILQIEDMAVATAQLAELKGLADQLKTDPVTRLYQAAQDGVSFEIGLLN